MSLTSLEQVFIKLAHEIDTSPVSAPKSFFAGAERMWQKVTDTVRNPMKVLSNHRKVRRDSRTLAESEKKIHSGQSHYVLNDSAGKNQNCGFHDVNDASEDLSSTSREVNPLMMSNMDLTTCTDNYSEDGNLNSGGHTNHLPNLGLTLPTSIKPAGTTSRGNEIPGPYDEQSSLGNSSFKSQDGDRTPQKNYKRDEEYKLEEVSYLFAFKELSMRYF